MSNLFPSNEIIEANNYFAITIGADENGKTWSETQTYFTGFKNEDIRIELRKIRAVDPKMMAEHWGSYREPFHVVNDDQGFVKWILGGGHALITENMTLKHMPDELEPRPSVKEGAFGFTDVNKLPKTAFQKAPSPKIRMAVLKRDEYRCMICGQRPADDVNIQLQTHHIRPYGKSGVTTENNLISLCHTCHVGLEPHFEYTLFDLIKKKFIGPEGEIKKRSLEKYILSVKNYRKSFRAFLSRK